jgi:rRNA maturation endonuclease Nob1
MEKLCKLIERFGDYVRVCTNPGCGTAFKSGIKTCTVCGSETRLAKELPPPELDLYRSLGD